MQVTGTVLCLELNRVSVVLAVNRYRFCLELNRTRVVLTVNRYRFGFGNE